jgi:hypothetical protein
VTRKEDSGQIIHIVIEASRLREIEYQNINWFGRK